MYMYVHVWKGDLLPLYMYCVFECMVAATFSGWLLYSHFLCCGEDCGYNGVGCTVWLYITKRCETDKVYCHVHVEFLPG